MTEVPQSINVDAAVVVQYLLESEYDLVKAEVNRVLWQVRALQAEAILAQQGEAEVPFELLRAIQDIPEDEEDES